MPIDDTDPAHDAVTAAGGDGVSEGREVADADQFDEHDLDEADAIGDHVLDEADAMGDHDLDDAEEFIGEPALTGDAALVARAKQRYGVAGAMLAGGMLGLDRMLTGKVKQEAPVEWEAPGEPLDIDRKGIDVPLEDERIVRSRPGPAAAAGATSRRVTRRRRS